MLDIDSLVRLNCDVSLRVSKNRLLFSSFLFLITTSLLTGCGSTAPDKSSEPFFDHMVYAKSLQANANNCHFNFSSSDHPPYYWLSKKKTESDQYAWIQYDDYSDYYEFRLNDPSYSEYDLEDVSTANKCIEFLSDAIEGLKIFKEQDASNLMRLYGEALANRKEYLAQSEIMTSIEVNQTNRAKYLEVEGAKRGLNDSIELLLPEIRDLIDFFYVGSVKVFLERCPDAYTVLGNDTVESGFVLLTNTSSSTEDVDLTVRFKDNEGVLIGDDSIYESVPGNSKVRVEISAVGSSGPVLSGFAYPPRCTFD